jgi:hypothetical protein
MDRIWFMRTIGDGGRQFDVEIWMVRELVTKRRVVPAPQRQCHQTKPPSTDTYFHVFDLPRAGEMGNLGTAMDRPDLPKGNGCRAELSKRRRDPFGI